MAGKPVAERLAALVGGLRKSLPFLKPRLPVPGEAQEPFDSLEDGTSLAHDDFEPNVALDITAGSKAGAGKGNAGSFEGLKAALDAILQSRLLLGIALTILLFLLALALVALFVNAPPRPAQVQAAAQGQGAGGPSPEGQALLRGLILPPGPDNAARVELERETSRVYTDEELAAFRTDPKDVDISGLKASTDAEIRALYGTVP